MVSTAGPGAAAPSDAPSSSLDGVASVDSSSPLCSAGAGVFTDSGLHSGVLPAAGASEGGGVVHASAAEASGHARSGGVHSSPGSSGGSGPRTYTRGTGEVQGEVYMRDAGKVHGRYGGGTGPSSHREARVGGRRARASVLVIVLHRLVRRLVGLVEQVEERGRVEAVVQAGVQPVAERELCLKLALAARLRLEQGRRATDRRGRPRPGPRSRLALGSGCSARVEVTLKVTSATVSWPTRLFSCVAWDQGRGGRCRPGLHSKNTQSYYACAAALYTTGA